MSGTKDARTYLRTECISFRKTGEAFGGLSNMAPGYPVRVNGVRIFTIEALYQACRFPHLPEVQRLIIGQHSPMTAKMVGKPYRNESRPDWDRVRVTVMRWCLRMKLTQHWSKFSQLLLLTGDRPIVEDSRKDDFWGAIPNQTGFLVGMNVLGRLLMELREAVKRGDELRRVEPPAIDNFLLYCEPLQAVDFRSDKHVPHVAEEVAATYSSEELTLPLFAEANAPMPTRAALVATTVSAEMSQGIVDGLKPYAEYKESGSKWLGAVPVKWEVRNLRTLISKRAERNRPDLPLLSVAREKGVFVRSMTDADENHNVIPDDLTNYKVARAGNLVINKMKAWQGSMGIAPCDGIVSPAYFVFDFRIANHMFGQRLLRSKPYVAHFAQASDGVRVGQWDLSIPGMRQIPVLVPGDDEQPAIILFLEHANRKIDSFIGAKRKLIGLLNERKQAIIHRAVTRGLDPDAPLKASGLPWLGDVPTHWDVTSLRRYWRVTDCKHLTVPFVEVGVPLASVREVQSFGLDLSRCKQTTPSWYRVLIDGNRKPTRGDLIYCRNASVGACALVETDIDLAMGQDVCLIRSKKQNQRFLNYLLHSPFMEHQLELLLVGSTFKRINVADIKGLAVVVPLREEQDAICEYLDANLSIYNVAIARTEREIALMQEYRTRLTADIVTGKLDVREAAAKLPAPPADEIVESVADEAEEEIQIEDTDA